MAYYKEYPYIMENVDASYDPLVNKLKEIIIITDQIFSTQIHPQYGLYPQNFENWIKDNQDFKPQAFTVTRLNDTEIEEIPYHIYYAKAVDKISKHLKDAKELVGNIQDKQLNKTWLSEYLTVLQEAFVKDHWDKAQELFVQTPQDSPILLSIGPIDSYHDKLFGIKRFFSAWLMVKNKVVEEQTLPLWNNVVKLTDESNNDKHAPITLYLGDLLFSGGEVAKHNSMGWSRPEDSAVAEKLGSVKAIAVNRIQTHTKRMAEAMQKMIEKSNLSEQSTKALMQFHQEHSLIPLLLHELGHTYNKSANAHEKLEQFYPLIEETRANTNMVYLAFLLEKEKKIPNRSAYFIFLRVLFYFAYLYEEFSVRQQREAYLFAALLWIKRAEDAKVITINNKLTIDEEKLEKELETIIESIRKELKDITAKGNQKEIGEMKKELFNYCEDTVKKL